MKRLILHSPGRAARLKAAALLLAWPLPAAAELVAEGCPRPSPSRWIVPAPAPSTYYRSTFSRLGAAPHLTDRFDPLIVKHAEFRRLNPRPVKAIIGAESEFTRRAVSNKGAVGLMQVMPATARTVGVHPRQLKNADENIRAGTEYLSGLFRAACRGAGPAARPDAPWILHRVIASYYAGPRCLTSPEWPPTTRQYVQRVLLFYRADVSRIRLERPSRLREEVARVCTKRAFL